MSIRNKFLIIAFIIAGSFFELQAQQVIAISRDSTKEYYSQCGIIFTDSFETDDINISSAQKRYTPTITDVLQAERILFSKYKETLEKDPRVIAAREGKDTRRIFWGYARQYLGFLDSNNHKLVVIHLLNFEVPELDKSRFYANFMKTFITGAGSFFEINITTLFADVNNNTLKLY